LEVGDVYFDQGCGELGVGVEDCVGVVGSGGGVEYYWVVVVGGGVELVEYFVFVVGLLDFDV